MRSYPINLNIQNCACLLVGAGSVGERKAGRLMDSGARLTVVAPEARPSFHEWHQIGRLVLKQRPFETGDVREKSLVIAATDDVALNQAVCRAARAHSIWCNSVQDPDQGDFFLPAVLDREGTTITVSTDGNSPALSKYLRRELEKSVGPEYGLLAILLGRIRDKTRPSKDLSVNTYRNQFKVLIKGGVLEHIRQENHTALGHLIHSVYGPELNVNDILTGLQPAEPNTGNPDLSTTQTTKRNER